MRRGCSFYSLRGWGWGSTCSNSQSYSKEMKTSISAELCRACMQNPFHFLAGSFTILCFHSWIQQHLPHYAYLLICTTKQIPRCIWELNESLLCQCVLLNVTLMSVRSVLHDSTMSLQRSESWTECWRHGEEKTTGQSLPAPRHHMTLWVKLFITHFAFEPRVIFRHKGTARLGQKYKSKCNSGYFLVLKIKSTSEESCFLHLSDSLRDFCDLLSAFTRLRGNTVIHFVIIK